MDELDDKRKKLNSISPSACLAKWYQSTAILQTGFTHSCHHPAPHKIPLEEIKADPSALHNTEHKKQQRQKMLWGERPDECSYCWKVEDLPTDHYSDRIYKSSEDWAWNQYDDFVERKPESPNPTYLEVSFDHTCNFKCAYCGPDISSKWYEEIKQHGAYPTSWKTGDLDILDKQGRTPYRNRDDNPYVNAFWEWWPDLYKDLHTFRITGGEPLLSKDTWKVFDYVLENPNPNLSLGFNSNMDVPRPLIDRLIAMTPKLEQSTREFMVFTSAEAHGRQSEYIRYGMDYERFVGNIWDFIDQTDVKVTVMMTFNALSTTSFTRFLDDMLDLRDGFAEWSKLGEEIIWLSLNTLHWPPFLSVKILPSGYIRDTVQEYREYAEANRDRLLVKEFDLIHRLCDYMESETDPNLDKNRMDFARFVHEYDRRRGLDFKETFPELAGFLDNCTDMIDD